jgi:hypothetical protein
MKSFPVQCQVCGKLMSMILHGLVGRTLKPGSQDLFFQQMYSSIRINNFSFHPFNAAEVGYAKITLEPRYVIPDFSPAAY